ncbi:MAG: DUF1835 domain-containing protein [Pyrinomonadaceae bacterium]
MKYHVLPGDSLVETFENTNIEGEIIVCRECLMEGDLTAKNLEEFWKIRENYLTKNFPQKEKFYAENVRGEFEKLLAVSPFDEINLWFEYELFCQTNLWFCLSLLSGKDVEIYRVAPVVRNENDLWKGFGGLNANDLEKCFEQRSNLSKEDVEFGRWLWKTFTFKDFEKCSDFDFEKIEKFPHLKDVVEAAVVIETRPKKRIREIVSEGETDFGKVFQKFAETEGVYGFGDLQVKKIYDSI